MTAQFNDIFLYHGDGFSVAGISEGKLFNPANLDLTPSMASTACWRGYIAGFTISDSRLILDTLRINLIRNDKELVGPVINGITPIDPQDTLRLFNNYYENLNYELEYTGGLLLAKGFIHELYVHMGFHPAWKYETVIELIFINGVLESEFDRSERMAEIRQIVKESSNDQEIDRIPTKDEIHKFVENAFDRTYKL